MVRGGAVAHGLGVDRRRVGRVACAMVALDRHGRRGIPESLVVDGADSFPLDRTGHARRHVSRRDGHCAIHPDSLYGWLVCERPVPVGRPVAGHVGAEWS